MLHVAGGILLAVLILGALPFILRAVYHLAFALLGVAGIVVVVLVTGSIVAFAVDRMAGFGWVDAADLGALAYYAGFGVLALVALSLLFQMAREILTWNKRDPSAQKPAAIDERAELRLGERADDP
jgi:hypothetical protein